MRTRYYIYSNIDNMYVTYAMYELQEGMTPLMYVSEVGHLKCIKCLISAGASVSNADKVLYMQQYL